MFIPQFSIRWLLGVTTVCAVVFSIVGMAFQGAAWAIGVSAAVLALVVAMFAYAAMFSLVWLFALVFPSLRGGRRAGQSPLAPHPPPPPPPLPPPPDEEETPATPIIVD